MRAVVAVLALGVLAGAHHIGYGEYTVAGGRLEARLTLEDARRGKMTKVIASSAPDGDVLSAATDLARQMASRISPYGTRNSLPGALSALCTTGGSAPHGKTGLPRLLHNECTGHAWLK